MWEYFDRESMDESDFGMQRLELKLPKYVKDELRRFIQGKYDSMSECVQDALIRHFAGFDYVYSAKCESEAVVSELIQRHTGALVSTVRELTDHLEKYAAPLKMAAESTNRLRETMADQIHAELQRRKQAAYILLIRAVYSHPGLTTSEASAYVAENLALPEVLAYEAVQELVTQNQVRSEDGHLHPIPLEID